MNVDALIHGLIDGNYDFEHYLMLYNLKQIITDEKEQMFMFVSFTFAIFVYILYVIFIFGVIKNEE